MKSIINEDIINKVNASFDNQSRNIDYQESYSDDIKINGLPSVKTNKDEISSLKNLRAFLEENFPVLDSQTKGK